MMKARLITVAILMTSAIFMFNDAKGQSNWELGVRFGDNFAIDATVPLNASPRLHLAAYTERFGIGSYFDWLFAFSGGPKGLKVYPGVGPEVYFEDRFDLAVAGDFGVEYSFNFPLTIGIDWRPRIQLTNDVDYYGGNWGLMARFRFGQGTRLVRTK